jgi:hypothetical protein
MRFPGSSVAVAQPTNPSRFLRLITAEDHPTLDYHNIIPSLIVPTSPHHVVTLKTPTLSTKPHLSFLGEISAHQIS